MNTRNLNAVIPAYVRYDKTLKPIEVLLYGEITCLSDVYGYSEENLDYYAGLYGLGEATIKSYLRNLANRGYIERIKATPLQAGGVRLSGAWREKRETVSPIKEKKVVSIVKHKVVMPFEDASFVEAWEMWKSYKAMEHKFRYKTAISEQSALRKLSELARDAEEAIAIINQSLSNGWKGLFKLDTNGKGNNNKTKGNIWVDTEQSDLVLDYLKS